MCIGPNFSKIPPHRVDESEEGGLQYPVRPLRSHIGNDKTFCPHGIQLVSNGRAEKAVCGRYRTEAVGN